MRRSLKAVLLGGAVAVLGGCASGMAELAVSPAGCHGPSLGFTQQRNNILLHTKRVQRISARYSAGYAYTRANPSTWTQIADGECRGAGGRLILK